MGYSIYPPIGIDFYDASLPTIPKFAPGTRVSGTDGVEFVYDACHAGQTITAGDLVTLSVVGSTPATTTTTGSGGAGGPHTLAVAVVSMTEGTYAWQQTKGGSLINCAASVAVGAPLYTTATAGQVSGTAAASNLILGIQLITATTGAAVTDCILSNPVLARGTMGA